MMKQKLSSWLKENYQRVIIWALAIVPILVSLISTIHVVNFFQLSNYHWLAVTLAVAFEIGALSSLAALAIMDKISKVSLWLIFILITLMQMMGNTYYAFDFITSKMQTHPEWTMNWIELFSINTSNLPMTKRLLAVVSGAILPIVSLSFLHILIGYIGKTKKEETEYEYVEEYVDEYGDEVEEIYEKDVITDPVTEKRVSSQSNDVLPENNEGVIEKLSPSEWDQVRDQVVDTNELYVELNDDDSVDSKQINRMNQGDVEELIKVLVPTLKSEHIQNFVEKIKNKAKENPNGRIDLSNILNIKLNKNAVQEPPQSVFSTENVVEVEPVEQRQFNVESQQIPEDEIEEYVTAVQEAIEESPPPIEESKPMSFPAGPIREDIKETIKAKPQKKKILLYREKKN